MNAELNQGPKRILLEEFIFNVYQKKIMFLYYNITEKSL